MRAELHKGPIAHAFVWGEGSDVENGLIRVYSYNFDADIVERDCSDYSAVTTRLFWANLLKLGFRRNTIPYHLLPSPLAR